MSIYSESDRYMWVFCITYYLAETCLIRLKIVVNKNNNKKENRKGKIMDFIELLKVIFLGIVEESQNGSDQQYRTYDPGG